MTFDARDLLDANLALLEEVSLLPEPDPALLLVAATWGRGADPELLRSVEPFRCGLGFNGSVVARLPLDQARELLPPSVRDQVEGFDPSLEVPICATVFGEWWFESWPRPV